MIEVSDLKISIGKSHALSCDNLIFRPGNIYCIRGKSGAGKTSFLNYLLGIGESIYNMTVEGSIRYSFDRSSQLQNSPCLGSDIILLQQSTPLWPHLNSFNNTWLPWASNCGIRELINRKNLAMKRSEYWLSNLGIEKSVWKQYPRSLSGGERQRVALASMLTFDCPCLLLDEPTSSLDQVSTHIVADILLEESRKGKVIIIVSHDLDFLNQRSWRHLEIVLKGHERLEYIIREIT
jgi:ABC-type multidrug transport system ATPase subunit